MVRKLTINGKKLTLCVVVLKISKRANTVIVTPGLPGSVPRVFLDCTAVDIHGHIYDMGIKYGVHPKFSDTSDNHMIPTFNSDNYDYMLAQFVEMIEAILEMDDNGETESEMKTDTDAEASATLAGHKRSLDLEILAFLQKRIVEERLVITRRQLFENRPTICGEDDAYNEATGEISDYRQYLITRRNEIIREFMIVEEGGLVYTGLLKVTGDSHGNIDGSRVDANEVFDALNAIYMEVGELIKKGKEMGEAADKFFQENPDATVFEIGK